MTEIQQNRWDQLIRRAANIVGGGSQVNDTLNELFPVMDVENVPNELLYLSGWFLGQGAVQAASVAAELQHIQLFNPAASGKLIVCERVIISTTTGQLCEYTMADVALTNNIGNELQRDTRIGVAQPLIGEMRQASQAAGLPTVGLFNLQASVQFDFHDRRGLFVLAPGTGVTFANTTVNTPLRCSFMWRERVAEVAELNF